MTPILLQPRKATSLMFKQVCPSKASGALPHCKTSQFSSVDAEVEILDCDAEIERREKIEEVSSRGRKREVTSDIRRSHVLTRGSDSKTWAVWTQNERPAYTTLRT